MLTKEKFVEISQLMIYHLSFKQQKLRLDNKFVNHILFFSHNF